MDNKLKVRLPGEPEQLTELRREVEKAEAKAEECHDNLIDLVRDPEKFGFGDQAFKGRVVSPEIDSENERRRFVLATGLSGSDVFTHPSGKKKKCDFCSNPKPAKDYPALPFTMAVGTESVGPWVACSACASLIDTNKWDELEVRAVESYAAVDSIKNVPRTEIREVLHETYRRLRENLIAKPKSGPGAPFTSFQSTHFTDPLRKGSSSLPGPFPVNLTDVKPAKNLRTDIAMDQELAERIANGNTDATYSLRIDPRKVAAEKLKTFIPDGVLFKIQNVHDYFMEHADEHKWYDPDSMFAVRLPFDRILFSYDHDFKNPLDGQLIRRHVNVTMEKATVADTQRAIALAMLSDKDAGQLFHVLDRRQPDSLIKTSVAIDGFDYPGIWFVMVDESGHVLTDLVHGLHWLWIRDPRQTAQIADVERLSGEPMQDAFARHGMICLTAVQFLNCRNVEVLDNPPTRQQRRHAERTGQKPPVTYKTLVIHPMGQKRRVVRQADGSAMPGVSLHLVRGHFKRYTEGKGLGRAHVHGVYWWSHQLRGSAEVGRVSKDYEIDVE